MEKLRRLAVSLTLISVLAVAAFAGETQTPPCAPGQTDTPPCASQYVTADSVVPGETSGPPALTAVDVTDIAETVFWALSLF